MKICVSRFFQTALFIMLSSFLYAHVPVVNDTVKATVNDKFMSYSHLLSPEKLYLHTDREVYCVGDTIWFKGYLKNNSSFCEFPESNYIYVELISAMVEKDYNKGAHAEDEQVRERVKIKKTDDGFSGYIAIPENLNTGVAVVRGYTYWMMNREPEYMFFKNVEIRNPMKDDFVNSMTENNIKDSYKYRDIGVENPFEKKREIARDLDVSFLPESGRYLPDYASVIAVKVLNEQGEGVKVSGEIFAGGESMTSFVTNDLGMGKLIVRVPISIKDMYAVVKDESGFEKKVKFPLPEQKALVMNVRPDTSFIWMEIKEMGIVPADSMFVVVHDGSELYFKVPYNSKNRQFKLATIYLTPGINNAAVVDKLGNVYAERSFFVYPTNTIAAELIPDKPVYSAREKVHCTLDLKDKQGNPLSGDFSVSVSDDVYAPYSGLSHHIVSYMLLGSELGSYVENPQSYFDKNIPLASRIEKMDLLMLTQGWKYYDLPKILKGESLMPYLGKEYTQSISGKVYGLAGLAKKSIVLFLAPSIHFSAMGQLDTSGWFALNGLDFPDNTNFIVGAVGVGGSKRRYTPVLNDDVFAASFRYPKYLKPVKYSSTYRSAALVDYYNTGGDMVYSINPVYITGERQSKVEKNISPLPNHQFKRDQYRDEKELEPYLSYDLLTYIVTTCPPLRFADSTRNGYQYIECRTQKVSTQMDISSGWDEIIVYINGIQSSCADLEGMQVSDITGFAYVKGTDAAKFGVYSGDALAPRSVVMVKTKMIERGGAVNVATGSPIGWQKPAKIYTPKYETAASWKGKEPMRSTIYWNPLFSIEEGKAGIEFYTSDHKSNYTIIIEGLTQDGEPLFVKGIIER